MRSTTTCRPIGARLQVPMPTLQETGDYQGWPWLLMNQLHSEPLTAAWSGLSEGQQAPSFEALAELIWP